jgi:hypothetical protein
MSLQSTVQGATHTAQDIVWWQKDDQHPYTIPQDLTSVISLTGTITDKVTSVTRAITGTLTVTDIAGRLRWKRSAGDVASVGSFAVQLKALYSDGYDATFSADWEVTPFN